MIHKWDIVLIDSHHQGSPLPNTIESKTALCHAMINIGILNIIKLTLVFMVDAAFTSLTRIVAYAQVQTVEQLQPSKEK